MGSHPTAESGAGASIFRVYHSDRDLVDRFGRDRDRAVDVIIPVINTNSHWRSNLRNFYAEIPIARLLIGDGGSTDDTIAVASEFPRVEVIDQRGNRTLGKCLRDLIERVQTEWFVYLHADVFLPPGWFETMVAHRSEYDWFECNRRMTVEIDYLNRWQNEQERAYSGSQMGRRRAFEKVLQAIEDDYLYRNEDIVIRDLLERAGHRYGRVKETFHWHQVASRGGEKEPDFERVIIEKRKDPDYERRTLDMQVRGIIKYTEPDRDYLVAQMAVALQQLRADHGLDRREILAWTAEVNPAWLPHVRRTLSRRKIWRREAAKIRDSLRAILRSLA